MADPACRRVEPSATSLVEVRIRDPGTHFAREGYVQMVPPLLLPLRTARNVAEVWLKLPDRSLVTTEFHEGQPLLKLPAGATAVRVEKIARGQEGAFEWSVADVRGTRFEVGKEVFFVLKPEAAEENSALLGWEWQRGSPEQQREATDRVAVLAGSLAEPERAEGQRQAARRANACASCHQHGRPANTRPREHGLANRRTDASGCFQVGNILLSRLPVETYFPLETNLENPFILFSCTTGEVRLLAPPQHPVCDDGSVPQGRFDVASAVAAANAQANELCVARKYLFDHLDAVGRSAFASGFAECKITTSLVTEPPVLP